MTRPPTVRTQPLPRDRRGSALVLVLLICAALAALAASAMVLGGGATVLSNYYGREQQFRYAADAALAMGKARITKDTTIHLPDSGYVTLDSGITITGADGKVIPNLKVNLYAGQSGNVTGQFGQYASVVADVYDNTGTRYVRRLELAAENFARFAMFTNRWPGVCYATGEFIRGRAHSNQNWQSCGSPTYYDTVSAVGTVSGGSPDYKKGKIDGAPYIQIPPVTRLAILHTRAVDGNLDIAATGTDFDDFRTRLEFVAIDLNKDSTLYDKNEGFFRVYQGNDTRLVRADYTDDFVKYNQCGDWHTVLLPNGKTEQAFFPVSVHNTAWFLALTGSVSDHFTGSATDNDVDKIMRQPNARCYLGGDPHLVAVERQTNSAYPDSTWQKGGDDTTFTDSTAYGKWLKWGGDPTALTSALAAIPSTDPYSGYYAQRDYLWPLDNSFNPGSHGVIHVHGPIGISGVLRGRVTLYAQTYGSALGKVLFLDDLVYTQDPASVMCANLFGVIADGDATIADNAINSPQRPKNKYLWMDGPDDGVDDTHNWVFDGVIMSRTGTMGVENAWAHPEYIGKCNGANTGRGCIQQAGGVIEDVISATFYDNGGGYEENRSVDQCLTQESPPYFPTTGRYIANRYYESDPARFDVTALFKQLQSRF